ncbi:MAG: hypothetical protein HY903_18150 [Deltaproteobacteria bacterium]|nr:hypothetical protein [Deltaproteobacteria bacterium]
MPDTSVAAVRGLRGSTAASDLAPETAVATLNKRLLGRIHSQIKTLEAEHAAKRELAGQLTAQISQRRQEIEADCNRKQKVGLIFAAFGYFKAGAVSMAMALKDDGRLRQLDGELAKANGDLARIDQQLAQYREYKKKMLPKLASLKAAESSLWAAAQGGRGAGARSLATAAARLSGCLALVDNLGAQAGILKKIRAEAKKVGLELDVVLRELGAARARAEQMAAASRKEVADLFKIATANDPDAAAINWARRKVDSTVRAAVEASVAKMLGGASRPANKELQRAVVNAVTSALSGSAEHIA